MNVIGLKNAAQIGLIRCSGSQAFDSRFLVTKGFKESIRETLWDQSKDGLFSTAFCKIRDAACFRPFLGFLGNFCVSSFAVTVLIGMYLWRDRPKAKFMVYETLLSNFRSISGFLKTY